MIYLLLQGCLGDPSASLTGRIVNSELAGIANANVTIRDGAGAVFSETEADEMGNFNVQLPALSTFFLEAEATNMPPTAFTGFAGEGETIAPAKTLIVRSEFEVETVINTFENCSNTERGLIDGRVAVDIPGQESTALPAVTTATIRGIDAAGLIYDGCYLPNEDGLEMTETGNSGRYAIMGLPEGVITLRVTVQYDTDTSEDFDHILYVPNNGATALDPTLIPL